MDKMTNDQAMTYIEEVYEEFKQHTLNHLTSKELNEVDSLMTDLVELFKGR